MFTETDNHFKEVVTLAHRFLASDDRANALQLQKEICGANASSPDLLIYAGGAMAAASFLLLKDFQNLPFTVDRQKILNDPPPEDRLSTEEFNKLDPWQKLRVNIFRQLPELLAPSFRRMRYTHPFLMDSLVALGNELVERGRMVNTSMSNPGFERITQGLNTGLHFMLDALGKVLEKGHFDYTEYRTQARKSMGGPGFFARQRLATLSFPPIANSIYDEHSNSATPPLKSDVYNHELPLRVSQEVKDNYADAAQLLRGPLFKCISLVPFEVNDTKVTVFEIVYDKLIDLTWEFHSQQHRA